MGPDSLVALIQARMGSIRLPGKVLADVNGKPLISYMFERVKRCKVIDDIVLLTSTDNSDDTIEAYCNDRDIACFRGPVENVALRFRQGIESLAIRNFVRLSGDSPMMDPEVIMTVVNEYWRSGADIATNIAERTFPKGQSVEVIRSSAFLKLYEIMSSPDDYEHVTRAFYQQHGNHQMATIVSERNAGKIQLSIDTPEDLERFRETLDSMDRPHWDYSWEEIVELQNGIFEKA